jgi:hypothetical protein
LFSSGLSEVQRFRRVEIEDCRQMLLNEPEIRQLQDRRNTHPVSHFIMSTLENGLPMFRDKKSMNKQVKFCLEYIFSQMQLADPQRRKGLIKELARGYTACQTVQYGTITSMFARLAGTEFTFETQVWKAVNTYKDRALDSTVLKVNTSRTLGDGLQAEEAPHIRNGYILALDEHLHMSLDGQTGARIDPQLHRVEGKKAKKVCDTFLSCLNASEFVLEFAQDINQRNADGFSRNFDRDKFYAWVMALEDSTFDKYSVFYDPDRPGDYERVGGAQPEGDRDVIPYLSPNVAIEVLKRLEVLR